MSGGDDQDRRTLPPSPKRVSEFRKRGEIGVSRDITMVAAMIGGLALLLSYSSDAAEKLTSFMRAQLLGLNEPPGVQALKLGVSTWSSAAAPVMVGAFLGCLVAGAYQLGWPPALKKFKPDFIKPLNPSTMLETLSPKAMAGRVGMSTAKTIVVAAAAGAAVYREWIDFQTDPAVDAAALAGVMWRAIVRVCAYGGLALVALAAIDLFHNKRKLGKKMKMTPEEAKREHREQEGDPEVNKRKRMRAREMARRRLNVAVKSADVVLVNPTEYAVALRYRAGEDGAPRVLAKGRLSLAQRIRDMARHAGIPILPRPPLTRAIYRLVPEGQEIPAELYHAVAEVLAHVYRIQRGSRGLPQVAEGSAS